jgi:transposase
LICKDIWLRNRANSAEICRTRGAKRCRLEPLKKLTATIKERFDAVVRGMLDHRSNAFVESMNGQLQQAKRAARGYRTAKNFIAIAYLRLSRLKNLPDHPFSAAAPVG